ncbi:hypothetical protein BST83_06190 [Polaribacter filamentus]|uniref:Uncharacterized protein n=1 Tax=Polaribacter filamentus TaxID=53483 RepID=A0A2S7KW01_9FLAO|nr:hypothetical protein [Polaribacter filamentus]PQB06790.1 hypothetical protein BST83_06190 [Polaribacter filamentus]
MNNTDKKAIKSLNRHKEKLKNPSDFDSSWVSKLSDLLLKYLGAESLLYNSAKKWYSFASRGNISHMNDCLKILENSIEFIEDNGVKKDSSFWRTLENTNKSVIVTILIFIINIIFWSGYLVSDYKKTKADYDLVIENIQLKDSLFSIRKTFKIPDNKSNPDTTTNENGSYNKKD